MNAVDLDDDGSFTLEDLPPLGDGEAYAIRAMGYDEGETTKTDGTEETGVTESKSDIALTLE